MRKRLIVVDGSIARVPLTQDQVALADAADVEMLGAHNWHALWVPNTKTFIARTHLPDEKWTAVSMHAMILAAPTGQRIDHANHDTLDNRRANLRLCTAAENARNRRGASSATGYLGVYPRGSRFIAAARHDSRLHHIGSFGSPEEAARARDRFMREKFPDDPFWTPNFE